MSSPEVNLLSDNGVSCTFTDATTDDWLCVLHDHGCDVDLADVDVVVDELTGAFATEPYLEVHEGHILIRCSLEGSIPNSSSQTIHGRVFFPWTFP